MLFHFLSIISLVRGAKGGEDVPIPHCNKQVTVGRDVRQRPTVDPQLCARRDTPACDAIFDIKGRPVDADGIAATIQSHSNPNVDYEEFQEIKMRQLRDQLAETNKDVLIIDPYAE
ncbi:unnamed protein product [Dracunculus medinensis]|uniref:Secreted protein n=1 Tax=Dracunculus medinensis TaxID=318479 RepID=A0A0N4URW3_DRAME|nr:unnamed protein product [Dracunculus medinensis]